MHSGFKAWPCGKKDKSTGFLAIGLLKSNARKEKTRGKTETLRTASRGYRTTGHMGKVHDHDAEQGHMTRAPKHAERDGAGRGGHDMEMHHRTEHKSPTHPEGSHTVQGYIPAWRGSCWPSWRGHADGPRWGITARQPLQPDGS